MTKPTWTPDRIDLLTRMWKEGASGAAIAAALGGMISRNAVIGKAHRLGLPLHDVPKSLREKKFKPARGDIQPVSPIPAIGGRVSLLDVEAGQCRYMFDEPRHSCCGAPVAYGPYCAQHALRCYQTNPLIERTA